ncbi:MAG: hypothetical protein O7B99_12770, partial [Planctomycetota bacterium]|nr:hypothetical protein [Planctomycetota bacterium]
MLGLVLLAAQASAPLASPALVDEPVFPVPVLRNGDFSEVANPNIPGIPWWEVGGGEVELVPEGQGSFVLKLRGNATLKQPLAAWTETVDRLVVRGRMRGNGSFNFSGGITANLEFEEREWKEFAFELNEQIGNAGDLRPRLLLVLSGETSERVPQTAEFAELKVFAPLPCPGEQELRAEILAELASFFDVCLTRTLDVVGERHTAFRSRDFDAVTGASLEPWMTKVGDVGLAEILFRAWRMEPDPGWEAALVRFLDDYLELCIQPETGLPRRWDPVRDVPRDDVPVEIRRAMRFLIDVAVDGPPSHRAQARAAALDIGRAVLRFGVLPDGEVAARYFPDGRTDMNYPPLRRLDVASQLARLALLTGDPELEANLLRAAREACLTLEYDHYWPGTWHSIDPGFDDNYGHYGERAVAMW